MRKLGVLALLTVLFSCADANKRIEATKKLYPKAIVEPSTGLLQRNGYEVVVIDTMTNQMFAVNFYPFSENKIFEIRNVR